MATSRASLPKAIVATFSGLLVFVILNQVSETLGASTAKPGKTQSNKVVMHANFANAGKTPGLEIWRIENFEPIPYPKSDYGKFYTGDSYIVMNTKDSGKGSLTWDIHFWLGQNTTQDESGSAALLTVQLDDGLGGGPVQYREAQGYESELFLSYFKNNVRYLPGGVKSGFHHTDINPTDPVKLYQVKGKKKIRTTQVPVSVKSMNQGDCYLLVSKDEIYIFCGEKSKGTERLTAAQVANEIRDEDLKGRGHVTKIEVGSSATEEIEKFFKILGSGSLKDVAPAPATDDDETFEKQVENDVILYKVSDASGSLKVEKVSSKPLKQAELKTDDCFILDTKTAGIYVWIGKKATTQEKQAALKNGEEFIKQNKYPSWTPITRVVEGTENTPFKKYFSDWKDIY